MKFRWHWLWYLMALISTVGMWTDWPLIKKWSIDGWFPLFCVVTGQLMRVRSGLEPDIFDRAFQSRRVEKLALASIVLMFAVLAGSMAYYEFIHKPAADRQAIEDFKEDYARWKEAKK